MINAAKGFCLACALFMLATAAGAQSDCASTLLGQPGCGPGQRPYVADMGNTLGSRGGGWYTNDPAPNDGVRGARPYTDRLGTATDSTGRPYNDTLGGSRSGCSDLFGMGGCR